MHYGTSMSYGFTPAIPLKGRVCARCFTLGNDDSITRDFDKDVLPKKTGFAGRLDGFTRVPCVATPTEATRTEATRTEVRDPRKGDMDTLKETSCLTLGNDGGRSIGFPLAFDKR